MSGLSSWKRSSQVHRYEVARDVQRAAVSPGSRSVAPQFGLKRSRSGVKASSSGKR